MSNVIKFPEKVQKIDPLCKKITIEDGKVISGGAAREYRLKKLGGSDGFAQSIIELVLENRDLA